MLQRVEVRLALLVALGVGVGCGSSSGDPATGGPTPIAGAAAAGMTAAGAGGVPGTGGAGGAPVGGAGAGVGGDPGAAGTSVMIPDPNTGAGLMDKTESPISRECRGFSFDGIIYSPGAGALPNTCEPFHPTTNNPYAVRCTDVWPWYKTVYPGDAFCILPPPPELGVQFGIHPQGKAYFDQVSKGDMSGYDVPPLGHVLGPGGEEERNYHTAISTTAEQKYYRVYTRMRGGSHHMINSTSDANASQEQWTAGSPDGLFGGIGLPGAQRPDENAPQSYEKPAEDAGLYAIIPGGTGITLNMHHFNSTPMPILKETWENLWWETDATIPVKGMSGLDVLQAVTLSVPVGATVDLHYAANISQDTRVLKLFGHRHAWTTSFTSWVQKASGENQLLYQSFDWFDEPTYRYDSLTTNPVADQATLGDGGASGITILKAGDRLHYNCHITYTDARAAAVKSPKTPAQIGTLGFANEAFTAEMCILFGSTAANAIVGWTGSATPLPPFAITQ